MMEVNGARFGQNIRYHLAKKQMESLFLKWISEPSTFKLVSQLITDVKKNEGLLVFNLFTLARS